MTLISRLTRSPLPYDLDRARALDQRFADLAPEARGLLSATGSCSPYLAGLMEREEGWLRESLCETPEAALARELAQVRGFEIADLEQGLRRAKRRIALLSALADLGGVWPLMQVTGALTELADAAVHACLTKLVGEEIRRGKLPSASPEDAATAGGMVALAMGKMGAGELNYSSDIDLICLYDETRYAEDDRV